MNGMKDTTKGFLSGLRRWLSTTLAAVLSVGLLFAGAPAAAAADRPDTAEKSARRVRVVEVPNPSAGLGFFVVGPGADMEDGSIVLNLKDVGVVTQSYALLVTPEPLSPADYKLEVDYDDTEGFRVNQRYDPVSGQYVFTVTAREMTDSSLRISLFKKEGSRHIMIKSRYIDLKVIDGEESPDEEDDADDIDALRKQAARTNMDQALQLLPPEALLTMDIGHNDELPTVWYQQLSRYPAKTLRLEGDRYAWEVKGGDIVSLGHSFRYHMEVVFGSRWLDRMKKAAGVAGDSDALLPITLPDLGALDTQAVLELSLNRYENRLMDLYAYQNGRAVPVAEKLLVDGEGRLRVAMEEIGGFGGCRDLFLLPHKKA